MKLVTRHGQILGGARTGAMEIFQSYVAGQHRWLTSQFNKILAYYLEQNGYVDYLLALNQRFGQDRRGDGVRHDGELVRAVDALLVNQEGTAELEPGVRVKIASVRLELVPLLWTMVSDKGDWPTTVQSERVHW